MQRVLEDGVRQGSLVVEDPGFLAARLLTQMMGSMHLARSGVALSETAPGAVTAVTLGLEQVRDACVGDALAVVERASGVAA